MFYPSICRTNIDRLQVLVILEFVNPRPRGDLKRRQALERDTTMEGEKSYFLSKISLS